MSLSSVGPKISYGKVVSTPKIGMCRTYSWGKFNMIQWSFQLDDLNPHRELRSDFVSFEIDPRFLFCLHVRQVKSGFWIYFTRYNTGKYSPFSPLSELEIELRFFDVQKKQQRVKMHAWQMQSSSWFVSGECQTKQEKNPFDIQQCVIEAKFTASEMFVTPFPKEPFSSKSDSGVKYESATDNDFDRNADKISDHEKMTPCSGLNVFAPVFVPGLSSTPKRVEYCEINESTHKGNDVTVPDSGISSDSEISEPPVSPIYEKIESPTAEILIEDIEHFDSIIFDDTIDRSDNVSPTIGAKISYLDGKCYDRNTHIYDLAESDAGLPIDDPTESETTVYPGSCFNCVGLLENQVRCFLSIYKYQLFFSVPLIQKLKKRSGALCILMYVLYESSTLEINIHLMDVKLVHGSLDVVFKTAIPEINRIKEAATIYRAGVELHVPVLASWSFDFLKRNVCKETCLMLMSLLEDMTDNILYQVALHIFVNNFAHVRYTTELKLLKGLDSKQPDLFLRDCNGNDTAPLDASVVADYISDPQYIRCESDRYLIITIINNKEVVINIEELRTMARIYDGLREKCDSYTLF